MSRSRKGKGFTNDAIPALSLVQSPIEGRFVQAFFDEMGKRGFSSTYVKSSDAFHVRFDNSDQFPNNRYALHGQVTVPFLEGKLVDFVVVADHCDEADSCAVEVDGAEFHASPETQKSDRLRDRLFIINGSFCMRFAGKEVYAGAEDCVNSVINVLDERIDKRESADRFSFSLGRECGIVRASKMTVAELYEAAKSIEADNPVYIPDEPSRIEAA